MQVWFNEFKIVKNYFHFRKKWLGKLAPGTFNLNVIKSLND